MIITKIETQKNKERVNIYLDGKFAFSISTEIKYKYNLKENMEIQEDFINKILMEEEQLRANNYALSYLSYRSRSKKEIVDKLKEKGFEDWIIQNCLDYLEGYGYVNDREFAKAFMRDKINMNKYGPQRIRYELYKKGISKEIIDKVLNEDDMEYERALELARKKISSYKKDNRDAIYRKLGGFLQRKGYSYDCIMKVLKEIVK